MDSDGGSSSGGNVAMSSSDEENAHQGPHTRRGGRWKQGGRGHNGMGGVGEYEEHDDDQERMAFTEDTDFVGGRWIDGEFYYEEQKQKKPKMSKEDAIYGVFKEASSSDDEQETMDDRIKSRMGGRRSSKKSTQRAPSFQTSRSGIGASNVSFVKSSKNTGNQEEDDGEDVDIFSEEDAKQQAGEDPESSSHAGLGSAGIGSTQQDFASLLRGARGEEPPSDKEQESGKEEIDDSHRKQYKKPPPPMKDLGKFEKHTKGFGMKYLSKFGFKGRLGKFEQGIAQPVAVQVRPDRRGINYGNFKEATHLKENKEIAKDYFGDDQFEDQEKKERKGDTQEWKKTAPTEKKKQPRKSYKTAAEVLQTSEADQSGASQVIVDMRGPQKKILTDMSKVSEQEPFTEEDTEVNKVGEELRHNLSLLADTTQVQLQQLQREISRNEHKHTSLEHDITVMERRITNREEEKESVDVIVRELENFSLEDGSLLENLQRAHQMFQDLLVSRSEEIDLHNLMELAPALVEHCFEQSPHNFSGDVDDEQELRLICETVQQWIETVSTKSNGSQEQRKHVGNIQGVVSKFVLPWLRKVLQKWSPTDSNDIIQLLRNLQPVVDESSFNEILQQLIFPRLRLAVEEWNPRTDMTPIDSWIIPWRQFLPKELETLFPLIRQKFSRELVNWDPSDTSARVVLERWKGVWSEQAMNSLLLRSVMPKLVSSMRELEIDPSSQRMKPWNQVMEWVDLIPHFHLVCLLEGEFFPKWLATLRYWLWSTEEVDLEEVSEWYSGWKQRFPERLLDEQRVVHYFDLALEMLDHYMSHEPEEASPSKFVPAETSYYEVLKRRQKSSSEKEEATPNAKEENAPSGGASTPRKSRTRETEMSLSFSEVVSHIAAENGVEFVPNLKRGKVDGKQVYRLTGKKRSLNIYLHNEVVYYEKQQGQFQPSDVDEVMQIVGTE
eukprot:gb/GECG01006757.1/.p1 GENE.gb/GECG01006757.1/~~gb/GECG01006757.1/.p1  ORF type:complete len:948 (+),score=210.74 gb/GECG01006757.1/:1-2844(+)